MPELPEVETVKNTLKANYLNKTISKIEVRYENILANIDKDDFCIKLINQKIIDFSRKGKFLIINLDKSNLLIHLRMEGKFKTHSSQIDKHSHVIIKFNDNNYLIYHDVRKFGKIYYFEKDINIFDVAPLNKLGLEPSEVTDQNYLYNKIKKINKPIKTVLLDQSILAGIGNIYADEICFACHISPLTKASNISKEISIEIIKQANVILKAAIEDGGSTIKTFQSSHGIDGLFQQKLKVYGKENVPCPNCNHLIVKTFVNQRGTHYCPNCQKG